MNKMDVIGDTCKDRGMDYGLIDIINRQYERNEKKEDLKEKLEKKRRREKLKTKEAREKRRKKEIEEKETKKQNSAAEIKHFKIPNELRYVKGDYLLQKGAYMIDFEIYVPQDCGLILEPGVEFYFTKDAGITCEGRFEAKGEEGLEVLLTAK
ncbi:MAG: hypothetical protein KAS15_03575, partial [Nanoarchaeota archaeon]|nr:hypothetical protein [Nanoarchaeota archaeon]